MATRSPISPSITVGLRIDNGGRTVSVARLAISPASTAELLMDRSPSQDVRHGSRGHADAWRSDRLRPRFFDWSYDIAHILPRLLDGPIRSPTGLGRARIPGKRDHLGIAPPTLQADQGEQSAGAFTPVRNAPPSFAVGRLLALLHHEVAIIHSLSCRKCQSGYGSAVTGEPSLRDANRRMTCSVLP